MCRAAVQQLYRLKIRVGTVGDGSYGQQLPPQQELAAARHPPQAYCRQQQLTPTTIIIINQTAPMGERSQCCPPQRVQPPNVQQPLRCECLSHIFHLCLLRAHARCIVYMCTTVWHWWHKTPSCMGTHRGCGDSTGTANKEVNTAAAGCRNWILHLPSARLLRGATDLIRSPLSGCVLPARRAPRQRAS